MKTTEDGAEQNVTLVDTNPTVAEKKHYDTFELHGDFYELEDTVLLAPEYIGQKPAVAIIKKITEEKDGNLMLTCQLLYRPEDAVRRNGGRWDPRDNRELFHSFKREVVLAATLMHKCVVHYVPLNKQLPVRSKHPGFIVQRVYDHTEKRLWKVTDNDYADDKQCEIDLLLQKTRERIELLDIEKAASHDLEHQQPKKKQCDVLWASANPTTRSDSQYVTVENTPGSYSDNPSYRMLANFGAFTGDDIRDKWLVKLLETIEFACDYPKDGDTNQTEHGLSLEKVSKDAAVPVIVALEKTSHVLSNGFKRYNRKMRQLVTNLKNNERLARRMLRRELEASVIVKMSAEELKEGRLTTEKTATRKEPAEKETVHIQMTDYECSRCMEKKVGLKDIMQAGSGERYQWECTLCGYSWFTSSR